MRANQRTLPQGVDRDGVNAQTPRQRQPVYCVIDTENLVTSCHPDSIGKFRLPERRSPGFIQQRHKLPGFFNERLCAEDEYVMTFVSTTAFTNDRIRSMR